MTVFGIVVALTMGITAIGYFRQESMMCSPFDYADHAALVSGTTEEGTLYFRVQGEFHEMPGLKLTVRQAARLFSVETARCERVLGALVHDGILATDGLQFARAGASEIRAHRHPPGKYPRQWRGVATCPRQ